VVDNSIKRLLEAVRVLFDIFVMPLLSLLFSYFFTRS